MTNTGSSGDQAAVALGAAIHAHMWRDAVTLSELGAVIGVSASTMGKKLRGRVPITTSELLAIADALGVSAGSLLPATDAPAVPAPRGCLPGKPTGLLHARLAAAR